MKIAEFYLADADVAWIGEHLEHRAALIARGIDSVGSEDRVLALVYASAKGRKKGRKKA